MAEFWDYDWRYKWARKYVDYMIRHSFRRIDIEGSFPSDGRSILITPNHTGTLMDALLVLIASDVPVSFGARADVFRNPRVAAFLRFCKMVPLARSGRDSREEVARNAETFKEIDVILSHGVPFAMFPEGRHRPMHSLLPLKKGVAYMAIKSAASRPTAIVPVGIQYSDWFHYRPSVKIRIGEPIDIKADYTAESILEKLSEKMKGLILYIPDDENYNAALEKILAERPRPSAFGRALKLALGLPVFVVSAILSLPMWLTAELICRSLKDKAFSNTVRFGVKLAFTPAWGLILAALFFCTLPLPVALLLLLAFIPSYSIFYDYIGLVVASMLRPS